MLKRIKARFSQDATDLDRLNEYGYVPTYEEMENPGLDWDKIAAFKRKYDF